MDILLATSNERKAQAIQSVLGRPVQHINLDLPEIQTIDVKEVIEQKARVAFELVGKPVLVEDTGLAVSAWNGLPGALVRWFLETVGNEGICRMLAGYDQLEATAETCLGFYDGHNFVSFCGVVEGCITRSPRGTGGFGWDPIFMPKGWPKTLAEMTPGKTSRQPFSTVMGSMAMPTASNEMLSAPIIPRLSRPVRPAPPCTTGIGPLPSWPAGPSASCRRSSGPNTRPCSACKPLSTTRKRLPRPDPPAGYIFPDPPVIVSQ